MPKVSGAPGTPDKPAEISATESAVTTDTMGEPKAEPTPAPKQPDVTQASPEIYVEPEKEDLGNYQPADESEAFIAGPTSRPEEPITAGLGRTGRVVVPKDFNQWFPILSQAASEPNAPPQLKMLSALLAYHAERA